MMSGDVRHRRYGDGVSSGVRLMRLGRFDSPAAAAAAAGFIEAVQPPRADSPWRRSDVMNMQICDRIRVRRVVRVACVVSCRVAWMCRCPAAGRFAAAAARTAALMRHAHGEKEERNERENQTRVYGMYLTFLCRCLLLVHVCRSETRLASVCSAPAAAAAAAAPPAGALAAPDPTRPAHRTTRTTGEEERREE